MAGPRRGHARGSGGPQQWQWPAKVIRRSSTPIERIRWCPRASRGAFRQVGTGMRRRTSSVETPAKSQTITTSDATFSRVPPPSASTPGLARHGRPGRKTRVFGSSLGSPFALAAGLHRLEVWTRLVLRRPAPPSPETRALNHFGCKLAGYRPATCVRVNLLKILRPYVDY